MRSIACLVGLVSILACGVADAGHGASATEGAHTSPRSMPPLDDWFRRPDLLVAPDTRRKALARSAIDRPDDSTLPQIRALYVLPADGADEALDANGTIARSVASGLAWLAGQTGGRRLRMDTAGGELDVGFFRMAKTDAAVAATGAYVRDEIEAALQAAGLLAPGKLYLVFYGGSSTFACAGGALPPSLPGVVGALYLKATVPGFVPCASNPIAPSAASAPGYWEFSWLHEMIHTQGFVASCAPHLSTPGHVADSASDLMYAGSLPWHPAALDVNHDDYFGHAIPGCPDFAASAWLAPAGGDPVEVVEYFHAGFGHYFVTALADEIGKLDAGTFAGWSRTGETFRAWPVASGRTDVCRFFTVAFAPRSSHFYTPDATECALVRDNPVWTYETIAFQVALPAADGGCATGVPLYRLYNQGQTGAPNHRYTTSLAIRAQMIALGFVPEGTGPAGVLACLPP